MASGQVIRLVNEGDSDFKDMYGSQPYSIPAGGQMFVDYDAMCLWLGHPEANDFDPRNRVRLAEYQRLRSRYGVDAKNLEQTLAGIPVDSDELFRKMRPKLSAYDASTGTQILTVADDPDGMLLTKAPDVTGDNQALILARMQQMEQEMAGLRSALAQQDRTRQALDDATPITNDNPDLADVESNIHVGTTSNIPGTVTSPDAVDAAPRPEPRQAPGEDSPSRVRISG